MAYYVTGLQKPQSLTGSGNDLYVLQQQGGSNPYSIAQIDLTNANLVSPWVTLPYSLTFPNYFPTGWILALGDFLYVSYVKESSGGFPPTPGKGYLSRIQISTQTITNEWVSIDDGFFTGLATDGTYLYVGDSVINTIFIIDPATPVLNTWTFILHFSPLGLVFANDSVYATASTDYTQIFQFDSSGNLINETWVTGGTLSNSAHNSLTTWNNVMYVSNQDGTVTQLDLSTGALTNASYISGYSSIQGIVAYDTYLYVADYSLGNLGRYALETPCFCRDTLLLTCKGYRKVQDLREGDTVLCPPDNRPVTIRKMFCEEIVGDTTTIPYRLPQHFFVGKNLPHDDIWISHNHAFFMGGQWTLPCRVPGLFPDISFLGKSFHYYHVALHDYGQDKLWCSGIPVDSWDADMDTNPLPVREETLCQETTLATESDSKRFHECQEIHETCC
jgi:hypothetical protein